METEKLRKRKGNFSETELNIMAEEVKKHDEILFSSFSSVVTNTAKKTIWKSICDKVNACSSNVRTVEEIRKKYQDYRSQVKKILCHHKKELQKTGGGAPPNPLTEVQLKIASMIPDCQIVGVEGGFESGIMIVEECTEGTLPEAEGTVVAQIPELSESQSLPGPSNSSCVINLSDPSMKTKKQTGVMGVDSKRSLTEEFIQLKKLKMDEERVFRKEMLELKRRKVEAIEKIAKCIENKTVELMSPNLSPVIQFLH